MSGFLAKMNPRERMILVVLATAGLVAAVIFFLVIPQLNAKSKVVAKQKAVTEDMAKAQKALQEAKEIKAHVAETRARLAKAREAVPINSQIPALIVDLPQVVDDAGVKLTSFSPGEPAAQGGVTNQPVELAVSGDFFDILDFLYRVQNFPRYFKVNKVSVTGGSSEGSSSSEQQAGASQLSANVSAVTFYTAPPPQIVAAEGGK